MPDQPRHKSRRRTPIQVEPLEGRALLERGQRVHSDEHGQGVHYAENGQRVHCSSARRGAVGRQRFEYVREPATGFLHGYGVSDKRDR